MNDLQMISERGIKKITMAKNNRSQFMWKSIMAGFYLGIAMILSYTLGYLFSNDTAIAKCAISFSFGIGLVCICFLNAELFTGNCLTIMFPAFKKQVKLREIISPLFLCYIGNMIGICLIMALFMLSLEKGNEFHTYISSLTESKLTFTSMPLLLRAILCNFVVCIASFTSHKMEDGSVKVMVLMLLVATFVIAGLEHCIANWGLFTMNFITHGFAFDWSQFPIHMILSTAGNILGGSILLGIPLYLSMKQAETK